MHFCSILCTFPREFCTASLSIRKTRAIDLITGQKVCPECDDKGVWVGSKKERGLVKQYLPLYGE